jgi:hypothetical protein
MMLIALLLLATPPAPTGQGEASRFVAEFVDTCMKANGDFNAMQSAAGRAGFTPKAELGYPLTIYASRGSHVLVYRGVMEGDLAPNAPQCSLQTDHIPGDSFEQLAAEVETSLKVASPEKFPSPSGRPVVSWAWEGAGRPTVIMLVKDRLLGETNVRLSIQPLVKDRPKAHRKRPTIRVIEE